MKLTYEGKMMVAGHRGDSANCPENTMVAFRAAIEAGADMIETDVRLTRDGVPVLIHDRTVDRTTDGKGYVKDMTFAELRALNAGTKDVPQQIPTLEEFLEFMNEHPYYTMPKEIPDISEEKNEIDFKEQIKKDTAEVSNSTTEKIEEPLVISDQSKSLS